MRIPFRKKKPADHVEWYFNRISEILGEANKEKEARLFQIALCMQVQAGKYAIPRDVWENGEAIALEYGRLLNEPWATGPTPKPKDQPYK